MSSNGATPLREKVQFPINTPVVLKLDFDDGTLAPGRGGDQYQYTFDDSTRIAWFDPPVRELIQRSGARAGDEICIRKSEMTSGGKRRVSWEVQKVEDDRNDAYNAELEARDSRGASSGPARERAAALASAPRRALPQAAARRPVIEEPRRLPVDKERVDQAFSEARQFADCLAAAMHATQTYNIEAKAQGFDFDWSKEDIRAIAATIYINRNGGSK